MAGTGFGLMVMPQLVKILLGEFGFRWTVVILGGLAFHAVLGSCLLQPIKRHLKEEPVDCEMQLVKVGKLLLRAIVEVVGSNPTCVEEFLV